MTTRQQRRAAERKLRKDARKQSQSLSSSEPIADLPFALTEVPEPTRALAAHQAITELVDAGSAYPPTTAQHPQEKRSANPKGGPRTAEGKAISALNNLQHGLTGAFRVLGNESRQEFDSLLTALTAEHQPATVTESTLVDKMAEHLWLSRRAQRLQDIALTNDDLGRFALYLRYQTTNDRAFYKALSQLALLKKNRVRFESQPDTKSDAQIHSAQVRLANARAEALELDNLARRNLQATAQNGITRRPQETNHISAANSMHRRAA